MPPLIRLYITQIIIGTWLAICFVALLLVVNVGNLRHLVFSSTDGWLGLGLLVFANAVVFSGVQFGIAVMRLAEPPADGGSGHRLRQWIAIPVRAGRDDRALRR
ncbi:hypothetical protein ACFQXB_07340 [Plastorhodobacter daqingensis]|uniref:Uncharacterized protein n=1 Tax=Plastorhodobacter daqingensis TaxID=1387281 RepID=A0ABW2UH56_9RHOB